MSKNYKPRFHCKTEAQKNAIKANYAKQANRTKKTVGRGKQQNPTKKQEPVSNRVSPPNPSSFQLPVKNGGRRWNIYRVPNYILNGKQDNDVHGGLVLDEMNDNVMLVEVTHSKYKKKNRKNLPIRNLESTDLDKEGNLRDSYIEKRLIVSTGKDENERGIDASILNKQMNDLQFDEVEKQAILDELSHLSTAEERYELFQKLAKEKTR